VANVDKGKESEIITGIYRFGRSQFKVYKTDAIRTIKTTFDGWVEEIQGGFSVAAADLDANGVDDVIAAVGLGNGPQVRAFRYDGRPMPQSFFAYERTFRGGVNIAAGDLDGDGRPEIITMPGRNTVKGSVKYRKYIEVDLSEQRLYAYENGSLRRTFLVSTGIAKYPTPEGLFSVTAKIPIKDYEWSYGPNHPDNYDIKDVKWNLRFAPTYYIHYAFWHNAFGTRRSHGCVNVNRVNAEWVYRWANVGTPVVIHE
ncbi:MAG: L,D-transpeptidase family protein, partial [Candidatus Kerfeldbacteria bacterium]|nr:L,D-transpeptidase family protein [Candidatus Kerfeldbacteria bacterium]